MSTKNENNVDNRPQYQLKHGLLSASIWIRIGEYGPMFSVQIQRSYQETNPATGENEWRRTTSMNGKDLLQLAKLADQTDSFCQNFSAKWKREDEARRQAEAERSAADRDIRNARHVHDDIPQSERRQTQSEPRQTERQTQSEPRHQQPQSQPKSRTQREYVDAIDGDEIPL